MVWLKFHLDDQLVGETQIILQYNYEIGFWLTLGAMGLAAVLSMFISDVASKKIVPLQPAAPPPQYIPPPGGVAPPPPPRA
jgi:hypothetical protein